MTDTRTPAARTAAAKREVRDALRFAGFGVADILANKTHVQVTLADENDVTDVLRMYPDAIAPNAESRSSHFRRTVRIPR